jgi:peptidoglycan/xylan/chitin deacetylase (PgdA/CDA1 family)
MAPRARGTCNGVGLNGLAMIGVIADSADHDAVREFFELFKTPWEFFKPDRKYEVLLYAGDFNFNETAKLVLRYSGSKIAFDDQEILQTGCPQGNTHILLHQGNRIPIYGNCLTFPGIGHGILVDEDSRECAAYLDESGDRVVARIGYDLLSEIRTLLTSGQPIVNASLPALDLHIAFLRDLITGCGIPLAEIPPIPDGYQFTACLTHDVDHPAVRQHKWDHTMFGFFYRAVFDSLRKVFSGQMSARDLFRNWAAALKLPFVHLGLAKDFWREFDDRYLELEKGLRSTFFVIPFSNKAGNKSSGPAPSIRAACYGAQDIADAIHKLTAAGCEVGLHGIDAWVDSSKGRQELDEIRRMTGTSEIGVRMHWLYYDQRSPVVLEQAGAIYDSTIGYNETAGYRAGTTQVYKPFNANHLLELPLHIMDTALFYPSHLGLSRQQAKSLVRPILDNAVCFGGALTINWHDRSLAPERLWGEFYSDLIQDLKSRGAWFSTASQATAWFRKRRSAEFETDSSAPGGVRAHVAVDQRDNLPALRLRIHAPRKLGSITAHGSESYVDAVVSESMEAGITSEAAR